MKIFRYEILKLNLIIIPFFDVRDRTQSEFNALSGINSKIVLFKEMRYHRVFIYLLNIPTLNVG